jgi:two-component system, OmpR family, sensor histidine kinase MtrB
VSEHDRLARAEHELRGAATALALICEALSRDPRARHHGAALDAQLDRLRAGLADLEAARTGKSVAPVPEPVELSSLTRAAVEFSWVGGPVSACLDSRRFAQALGNMLANATEHGAGDVRVVGRALDGRVSVEVRNAVDGPPAEPGSGRGRGLLIASSAAEELGGRLSFEIVGDSAVATLDLPDA